MFLLWVKRGDGERQWPPPWERSPEIESLISLLEPAPPASRLPQPDPSLSRVTSPWGCSRWVETATLGCLSLPGMPCHFPSPMTPSMR